MAHCYLSYDIRQGHSYELLYKVLEKYKAKRVSESLYRINLAVDPDLFVLEVWLAVRTDDTVRLIVNSAETKELTDFSISTITDAAMAKHLAAKFGL